MKKRLYAAALLLCLLGGLCGCGGAEEETTQLRIAVQYGMQYAPVYVMRELGLLEKRLDDITPEWTQLGGGSACNEALLSGSLDAAFMGIPPALIAIGSGADYRIGCGICVPPSVLMTQGAASLAELDREGAVIAVPAIGSVQHIMLSYAAQELLGDASALDDNLVAMSNADAYAAFATGSVTAHFASMPYILLEQELGMTALLDAEDCGGGASIVCVCTPALHDNERVYTALMEALTEAIGLIAARDEEAIRIIAETEQCTQEQVIACLDWAGTQYTDKIIGLTRLGEFMLAQGYIDRFDGFDACVWEGASGE